MVIFSLLGLILLFNSLLLLLSRIKYLKTIYIKKLELLKKKKNNINLIKILLLLKLYFIFYISSYEILFILPSSKK